MEMRKYFTIEYVYYIGISASNSRWRRRQILDQVLRLILTKQLNNFLSRHVKTPENGKY